MTPNSHSVEPPGIPGRFSHATINRHGTAARAWVRWMRERYPEDGVQVLEVSVSRGEARREDRHMPPAYFAEVVGRLEKQDRTLYAAALRALRGTGLRIDELQGLRVRDVAENLSRIHVREYTLGDRKHVLKGGKGSERDVPITEPTQDAWRTIRGKTALPDTPYLHRSLLDYDHVQGVFERAVVAAGYHDGGAAHHRRLLVRASDELGSNAPAEQIEARARELGHGATVRKAPDYTLHSLRHAFGVGAIKAGLDVRTVAKLLGHQDLSMVMRYTEWALDEQEQRDIAGLLATVLT